MTAQADLQQLEPVFLNSRKIGEIAADHTMVCLDIGARRGFSSDLLPLAFAVNAVGFEPDEEECQRLNLDAAESRHPWLSLRFLPVALGPEGERKMLNLYRQRGCSSLLQANQALAAEYSRGDDYILDGTVPVDLMPLDDAAIQHDFQNADYMKIDIQGYEQEVFRTGPKLICGSILAVRCEVSSVPIYHDQPLLEDILADMRAAGFVPMGFEELHHWRRTTRVKHPRRSRGKIPYSRGQMVHGDMLFFKDPRLLPDDGPTIIKAAILAFAYGYFDHGAAILSFAPVEALLRNNYDIDVESEVRTMSRAWARTYRSQARRKIFADIKFRLRQMLPK